MEPGNRKELRVMGYGFLILLGALILFVIFCGVAPVALGVIAARKPRRSMACVRIIVPMRTGVVV